MAYVYSTLTCDNEYVGYKKDGQGNPNIVERSVRIAGGHGLMNRNFLTPRGMVTEVTDEELEFLKTVNMFKLHVENGFITYDNKKVDAEKVAANMRGRDESSQIVPADYEKGGKMDVVPTAKK